MKNLDLIYLDKLRDYYANHKVLPSYSGVAKLIGLKSTSAVSVLVKRLKESHFLESAPDKRLQPGPRFFDRPLVDVVVAGNPEPANNVEVEGLNIDAYLIDNPSRIVLLKIKGDSMIDAGLLPGDIVIVKRAAPHKVGNIVVAKIDQEYTVKYLAQDKNGFYLKAGNPKYVPIQPKDDLEIYGVVTGSFRKYS